MTDPQPCEAFVRVAELGAALGVRRINEMVACWEHQVDERWWISVNGHNEPCRNSDGQDLQPFTIAVKFNGWPAGLFNPAGGIIAAGAAANEDAFIEALKAATKRAEHPQ